MKGQIKKDHEETISIVEDIQNLVNDYISDVDSDSDDNSDEIEIEAS